MPIPKQPIPEKKFDLQKELKFPHNQYCVEMFTITSLAIAFLKYALREETILPLLDLEKLTVYGWSMSSSTVSKAHKI